MGRAIRRANYVTKLHTRLDQQNIIPKIKSKQGYCKRYLDDYANPSIIMHRRKKIEKTAHNFSLSENKIKCTVHGWKLRMNKQLSERNGGNDNFLNFPKFYYPDKKFCAIISKIEDPQDTCEVLIFLNTFRYFHNFLPENHLIGAKNNESKVTLERS